MVLNVFAFVKLHSPDVDSGKKWILIRNRMLTISYMLI
jgi:hypothetical protein